MMLVYHAPKLVVCQWPELLLVNNQALIPNKEMKIMAHIYANLIRKGIKTIDDVPESKRAEVEAILDGSREF